MVCIIPMAQLVQRRIDQIPKLNKATTVSNLSSVVSQSIPIGTILLSPTVHFISPFLDCSLCVACKPASFGHRIAVSSLNAVCIQSPVAYIVFIIRWTTLTDVSVKKAHGARLDEPNSVYVESSDNKELLTNGMGSNKSCWAT